MNRLFTEADVFLVPTGCTVAYRFGRVFADESACDLPWSRYCPSNSNPDLSG